MAEGKTLIAYSSVVRWPLVQQPTILLHEVVVVASSSSSCSSSSPSTPSTPLLRDFPRAPRWSLDWLSDPRNAVSEDALAHALPAAAHRVPHIPPLIDHQIRVCSGQEICPHATVAHGLRCRTSYCLRPSIVMNLDFLFGPPPFPLHTHPRLPHGRQGYPS